MLAIVSQTGHQAHETGAHPENAGRLLAVLEHLSEHREDFVWLEPRAAAVEDVERSHTGEHVASIRSLAERGGGHADADTVVSAGSFEAALDSAGTGLAAVDAVLAGKASAAFCLNRPPGHHATADRAMGFCLFNNASIAARYAQAQHGLDRIAILDWDVHHGNGTQDIHYADPSVLYISLHQWPLYPGTGWVDERGAGEGAGCNLNLPMPPGSGDREHLEAFEEVVEPALEEFSPELLIVSAGQDGHAAEDLAHQMISVAGFHGMAERAAGFARRRGIGLVAVHEGGYNPRTLPQLDHAILGGFGSFATDLDDGYAVGIEPHPDWPQRLAEIRRAL